jgi:hypothetical protein
MKAYNNGSAHTDNKYNSKMMIAQMIQASQPDPLLVVPCAPPWECLSAFGGHMTIDEFRNAHGKIVGIHIAPVKCVSYDIDWNSTTKKSGGSAEKTNIDALKATCSSAKVINNPLKIKQRTTNSDIPNDSVLCMLNNLRDSV